MSLVVVQHCFGMPNAGGPATALSRLQNMRAQPYPEIWQRKAAGGISFPLVRDFVRQLRRLRPDVLHVRGLGNEGFHAALAGRLARVPRILVSVHGTQRDLVGNSSLRRAMVVNLLEPATLKMADAIVTMCQSAAQRHFLDPVRHKLLTPVANGVPLPSPIELASGAAVRQRFGIAADRIVAVIVSRLTAQKGYTDLAHAFERFEAAGIEIDLIVVGSGDEDGRIAELFSGLVRCRAYFAGQQDDVGPYLAAADLFVFPSWHENLSNALLEAMAYRLPVVATAVGGNVEVIEHGGGGILVPAHDPKSLAGAILRLASDATLRIAMGHCAYETIVKHYSLERMVHSWEAHYHAVAAKS